jgi:hypothetical protein
MSDCPLCTTPPSGGMRRSLGSSLNATRYDSRRHCVDVAGFATRDCVPSPRSNRVAWEPWRDIMSRWRPSEAKNTERSSLWGQGWPRFGRRSRTATPPDSGGDVAYPTDRILGDERLDAIPNLRRGEAAKGQRSMGAT